MRDRSLLFMISSALITLILVLLYQKNQLVNQINNFKQDATSRIESVNTAYKNIIHNQHLIESYKIKSDLMLVDNDFNRIPFDSLLNSHKHLLILRFFWDTCED